MLTLCHWALQLPSYVFCASTPLGAERSERHTSQVHRSGILTAKGPLNVLDNACGTGTVSQYLMDSLPADRRDDVCLTLADISPNMVDAARTKAEDKGWKVGSVQTVDMQVRDRTLLVWHYLSDS